MKEPTQIKDTDGDLIALTSLLEASARVISGLSSQDLKLARQRSLLLKLQTFCLKLSDQLYGLTMKNREIK